MNASEAETKVIWRFSDGRPGHDAQSQGLVSALSEQGAFQHHDVQLPFPAHHYPMLLFGHAPAVSRLPEPDIVIGAGHATHLPLLLAKWAYKSIAIVLMRPSLPLFLFDYCLVPQHDNCKESAKVISTLGPLNCLKPSVSKDAQLGLVLIGGLSRHFDWDEAGLTKQLQTILNSQGINWVVADSPRTPQSTRDKLKSLAGETVDYRPFKQGDSNIAELMCKASQIWVSEDSMSMIYESLSSGAAVGILRVPAISKNKLSTVAESLAQQQMLTLFENWQGQERLRPPQRLLAESQRCAEEVLQRLNQPGD